MKNKKTVAIIATLDTKGEDVLFLMNLLHGYGHGTFIVDVGSRGQNLIKPDVDAVEIAKRAGKKWSYPIVVERRELVETMGMGIEKIFPELYEKGYFEAVISIGGLQNTTIAVRAMKTLPIGVPKIMVSTMASGKRPFELIVGYSDIVPFPSLADFSGGNIVSDNVLRNAAAAISGMVERAGKPLSVPEETVIGLTTMGVINRGTEEVVKLLKGKGYQVVCFHSTGVGGKLMDKLIKEEIIKAALELSLHEIVAELFGGYASGAQNRLVAACEKGIPQVIVPGGCDFIDFTVSEIDEEMFRRKHVYHNQEIVHLKLYKDEIVKVADLIVSRLNNARGPVTVVIPLRGFRENAEEGGALYDPDVDYALIKTFESKLKNSIKIVKVDANINDKSFAAVVSDEMQKLLE